MLKFLAVLVLLLPLVWAQQCPYGADIVVVYDSSDANIFRDANFGVSKRGVLNNLRIHDVGPGADQTKLALCNFADTARAEVSFGDAESTNFAAFEKKIKRNFDQGMQPIDGFTRVHLGIWCAINQFNSIGDTGRPKLLVLVMFANDEQTAALSEGNATLARNQGIFISGLVIGSFFRNRTQVASYGTRSDVIVDIASFKEFEIDSLRDNPNAFTAFCPACWLSPVEGNPQEFSQDGVPMRCPAGMVFDKDLCQCIIDVSTTG